MSVTALKGVGVRNAERLAKIGVQTVQDVLFHLPFRYQDRTRITPMYALRLGDQAVVEGVVEMSEIRFGRRRSLLVVLSEGNASLTLRFFHFSAAQKAGLAPGVRLRCFGEVRSGPKGLEMVHPEYHRVDEENEQDMEESLTPIYPTTEGMHQLSWRGMTDKALAVLAEHPQGLPDLLPEALLRSQRLPELAAAVRYLHRPPPDASLDELAEGRHPAQRRLAFEELLAHQLSLRELRRLHKGTPARALAGGGELGQRLMASLPFKLTAAQLRVAGEIGEDLRRKHPMMRLVQGDVGSGKTVVSALAVLQALESKCQAALMAPPNCWPSSTCATFVAGWSHWVWKLPGSPGVIRARQGSRYWNPWHQAKNAWWLVPTPCSRRTLCSVPWDWLSLTSSIGSGCTREWPCGERAAAGISYPISSS